MTQWQPIETAPQTSKAILVYCSKMKNTFTVYWDVFSEGGWAHFGGRGELYETPTHWMPLPPPPEVTE